MNTFRRIVHRDVLADAVTPIGAYLAIVRARKGPAMLFESALGAGVGARRSLIGVGARGEVRVFDGEVSTAIDGGELRATGASPLDACRSVLESLSPAADDIRRSPFFGLFGAAAHEFSGYLERLPHLPRAHDPMPDLHLVVPETLVVFDHFTHRATITTLAAEDGTSRDDADIVAALTAAPFIAYAGSDLQPPRELAATSDGPGAARFCANVAAAKAAIYDGEVFQVVLSQGRTVESDADPFDVYRALRSINPSPYMFFIDLGWGQLLGSSPELLAKLEGRRAIVRPLAGTRARSDDPETDRKRAAALRRDPKERAEHTMLVDLGRNDVGRVCTPGSVCVDEFMDVERFSHVMHLASEVSGELKPELDAFDLMAAAFPAGTVSGAPKVRALELIAQLEGTRRGFYAGAVLRFGFDGSLDSCITLRSMHAYGGAFHLRAGAGIVEASDPEGEDRECRAKLGATLAALAMAAGGLPA
ncbi:MAG TPA: anthranilate synthase component I family protein [Candidatus Eremiobacteraceae bacterium]